MMDFASKSRFEMSGKWQLDSFPLGAGSNPQIGGSFAQEVVDFLLY